MFGGPLHPVIVTIRDSGDYMSILCIPLMPLLQRAGVHLNYVVVSSERGNVFLVLRYADHMETTTEIHLPFPYKPYKQSLIVFTRNQEN